MSACVRASLCGEGALTGVERGSSLRCGLSAQAQQAGHLVGMTVALPLRVADLRGEEGPFCASNPWPMHLCKGGRTCACTSMCAFVRAAKQAEPHCFGDPSAELCLIPARSEERLQQVPKVT